MSHRAETREAQQRAVELGKMMQEARKKTRGSGPILSQQWMADQLKGELHRPSMSAETVRRWEIGEYLPELEELLKYFAVLERRGFDKCETDRIVQFGCPAEFDAVAARISRLQSAKDRVGEAIPFVDTAMPEEAVQALPLLREALELAPEYALAHGYAAFGREILWVRAGKREEDRWKAIGHADSALAYGQRDARALTLGAFVKAIVERKHGVAFETLEAAAALSPHAAFTYSRGSMVFGWAGESGRAIEWGRKAVDFGARNDPWAYCAWHGIFAGHFKSAHYEEAEQAARAAIACNGILSSSHALHSAALAVLGLDEAKKAAADKVRDLEPGFSVTEFCNAIGAVPAIAEPLAEALRAAGLPGNRERPYPSQLGMGERLKIISGGQTGPDRAAIDVAKKLKLPYGGWVPKGGWAEDCPKPPGILPEYPDMLEAGTTNLEHRTRLNIHASDATLVLITEGSADLSLGTNLTVDFAHKFGRPFRVVRVDKSDAVTLIIDWLKELSEVRVLNVAGPREKDAEGIQGLSYGVLETVLREFLNL